jgi:hypothetical protein
VEVSGLPRPTYCIIIDPTREYYRISKEISSLHLGLMFSAFSRLESNELDTETFPLKCWDRMCANPLKCGATASNEQSKISPIYNDDISLLIYQYIISEEHTLPSPSPIFWIHMSSNIKQNFGAQLC